MSERIEVNDVSEVVSAEENDLPFALQFLESIPQEDEEVIQGHYNPNLQVWQYDNNESVTQFPVATFPSSERPPTTSTVPTRVTPTIVKSDTGVDD